MSIIQQHEHAMTDQCKKESVISVSLRLFYPLLLMWSIAFHLLLACDWFVLAQVRQQVSIEPLPAELEVVALCGQKNQLSRLVHGSQAKAILHEDGGWRQYLKQPSVLFLFSILVWRIMAWMRCIRW